MNKQPATNDIAQYAAVGTLDHPAGDRRMDFNVYECPVCLSLTRRPDAHLEYCGQPVTEKANCSQR
ncbi:MAG: hypothetical protein ABJC62_10115 [Frankiaceae bacterium]|jgi:hypothetical protein